MDAIIVFLLTTIVCYIGYFFKDFNYWRKKNIPYLSSFSYYGNILSIVILRKSVSQYLDILHKKCITLNSKYMGFWIAEKPCLYIADPELIKKILVTDFAHFSDRLVGYKSTSDSLGTSSFFLLKGNHWKNMRSRLNPMFTPGRVKNMEGIISKKNVPNLLEFISQHNKVNANQPLASRDLTTRFAADNMIEIYLGLDGQCLKDMPGKKLQVKDENVVPKYNDIGNHVMSISPRRAFKFFSAKVSTFFREIFWTAVDLRRKQSNKEEEKTPRDLLSLLMKLNDDNIEVDGLKYKGDLLPAQFSVLFVAGFETTSSLTSLFLATMTQYPKIQELLRKDIKKVLLKHNKINYVSISEMEYLDKAFMEIVRLYPTLPLLDRLCTKSYKVDGASLVIDEGTKIFISLTGIHTDPRYWKDPHKFDPDRFSPENKSNIVPFSYIPFGAGPKICIGERFGHFLVKSAIATILSKYRVRADGSIKTEDDLKTTESYASLRIPMATRGVITTPDRPLTMYFDYMPLID